MAKFRTVLDLLAEQGEDELRSMREMAVRERDRWTLEVQQIDDALALRKRNTGRGPRTGLTQEMVLTTAKEFPDPFSPADITAALKEKGIAANANAIRNHLRRLAERDELTRDGNNYFVTDPPFVPGAGLAPAPGQTATDVEVSSLPADDDIPF